MLDFYIILTARALGLYVQTENPKSGDIQDGENECQSLAQRSYLEQSESYNNDLGPLTSPSTTELNKEVDPNGLRDTDREHEDIELGFLEPPNIYSRGNERQYRLTIEQIVLELNGYQSLWENQAQHSFNH